MTSSIKKKVRYIGLQEDGRVDTAQNILNEFFDSPSFQRMKQKVIDSSTTNLFLS